MSDFIEWMYFIFFRFWFCFVLFCFQLCRAATRLFCPKFLEKKLRKHYCMLRMYFEHQEGVAVVSNSFFWFCFFRLHFSVQKRNCLNQWHIYFLDIFHFSCCHLKRINCWFMFFLSILHHIPSTLVILTVIDSIFNSSFTSE